ncbi:MAG: putative glycoside hydrolase [Candidatus Cloacimonetes bacterium]|nr:putative glycoside hydrolase [Candidatus Cloacimonadota bacterium]MCF7813850.1 putative glycoside hydrolase [Candidatus Cloacimonadota bacterium]MCF7868288.1 putative glycoside hydrolase [Candidatus Cloacimonadota bacterium]MCF7883738.1 putative glycoside hydrolase [Candidatus Cloacimonadota bacterium]
MKKINNLQGGKLSPLFCIKKFYFLCVLLLFSFYLFSQNIQTDVKQDGNKKVDSNKYKQIENVDDNENNKNEKNKSLREDFIQGLYLTAYKAATNDFHKILDQAQEAGINTVVFDLKNMNGDVFFSMPQNSFLTNENLKPIIDIPKVVNVLHSRNMKAVSRVVMFHDEYNAERDSTLRAANSDGTAWVESERRGPSWMDSSNPRVQEYLFSLIEQIAKSGVDEIQMDYVRFPTQGHSGDAIFYFQREDYEYARYDSLYILRDRDDIILEFVKNVKAICDKYNVSLAADVFAIVAWQRNADIKSTGQNIGYLSKYLDKIHPMIYSSHFADNFSYRKNVPNEVYHLMYKGTKLTMEHAQSGCKVIPYIQANSWKVNYKEEYMHSQIQAIKDLGASGYILWNSSNRYEKTLTWIKNFNYPN